MNPREPLSPEEQALASRLREWSPGAPPEHLDAAILAQARGAVARTPHRRRHPWRVGVASAAALVLTVGVVWRTLDSPQDDGLMSPPPASPVMRAPGAGAPDVRPRDRIEMEAAPAEAPPVTASSRADDAAAVGRSSKREDAFERAQQSHDDTNAALPPPFQAPAPPPPEPASEPSPVPLPSSGMAPSEEMSYSAPYPTDAESIDEHADRPSRPPAPAADAEGRRERDAGVSPAGTRSEASHMRASPEATDQPAAFEQGIETIRRLLREDRLDEARRAAVELRDRFPDRPLPPDIAEIVPAPDPGS